MSRRRIHVAREGNRTVAVYRDPEWDEYQVELWIDGVLQKGATAHDDDKDSALLTAEAMLKEVA